MIKRQDVIQCESRDYLSDNNHLYIWRLCFLNLHQKSLLWITLLRSMTRPHPEPRNNGMAWFWARYRYLLLRATPFHLRAIKWCQIKASCSWAWHYTRNQRMWHKWSRLMSTHSILPLQRAVYPDDTIRRQDGTLQIYGSEWPKDKGTMI